MKEKNLLEESSETCWNPYGNLPKNSPKTCWKNLLVAGRRLTTKTSLIRLGSFTRYTYPIRKTQTEIRTEVANTRTGIELEEIGYPNLNG